MRSQTMKRMVWNVGIFVGLIALTFWLVFKDQDIGEVFGVAVSAN